MLLKVNKFYLQIKKYLQSQEHVSLLKIPLFKQFKGWQIESVVVLVVVVVPHKPQTVGQSVFNVGIDTHCDKENDSQMAGSLSHNKVSHTIDK